MGRGEGEASTVFTRAICKVNFRRDELVSFFNLGKAFWL